MIGALRCGAQPALFRSAMATTTCAVKPVGLRNTSLLFASTVGQQQQAQLQRRTLYASPIARKVAKRFTAEHEWVAFDDAQNIGTIGITEYAQKSLGDVVYVELPSEGSEVKQGEQIGAVESVKAASDIYSPVTGQIQSVNDKLGDEPGLLNKSPEENGWLCKIRLTNPAEFEQLLDAEAYKKLSEDA